MPRRPYKVAQQAFERMPFPDTVAQREAKQYLDAQASRESKKVRGLANQTERDIRNRRAEIRNDYLALRDQATEIAGQIGAGEIGSIEGRKARDRVVRAYEANEQLEQSLTTQAAEAARMKDDPLAWADEQVERFPAMRDTLPDYPF